MRTIIHLLNTGSFSGAENVVIILIGQMKQKYGDQYRFLYASRPGSIEERLKKEGIGFIPVEKMSVGTIKRIYAQFRPDLIHAHDFTASMVCAMAGLKCPLISHLHCDPLWMRSLNIKSTGYYLTASRYKRILTVSDAIEREYIFGERLKGKLQTVGNPVSRSVILKKAEEGTGNPCDIVFLGRLSEEKNPLRLIDIVGKLARKNPSVTVLMIGDGPLKGACMERIGSLGLEKNIKMTGFLDNPYSLVKEAKVLCITSRWEGFGLMAAEALTLGVPVVTTCVGGLKEIVNESCGYFCETDGEFAEKIDMLLKDGQLRQKLSAGALARAEQLDNMDVYIQTINDIYSSIERKGRNT